MKKNEKNGTLSDIDMDWRDTSWYIQISGGYKNRNLETPFLSVFLKISGEGQWFQKWIFIHSDKYVAKTMNAVRDPIVLWEAEISSFLPIWTLFARNDFEIDKKPYVIEKMIFFLFMGTEFFYK